MTRKEQLELLNEAGVHLVGAILALQKLVTGAFRAEVEEMLGISGTPGTNEKTFHA
jgi:hypothetical protein